MRHTIFEALFDSRISGSTASAPVSSSKPEKGGGRRKEGGKEGAGRQDSKEGGGRKKEERKNYLQSFLGLCARDGAPVFIISVYNSPYASRLSWTMRRMKYRGARLRRIAYASFFVWICARP